MRIHTVPTHAHAHRLVLLVKGVRTARHMIVAQLISNYYGFIYCDRALFECLLAAAW